MIIADTYKLIKFKYPDFVENLYISDVRIGVHLTSIRLSDGSCGISSTYIDRQKSKFQIGRYHGPYSPGKILGRSFQDLFEQEYDSEIVPILRTAALNALSPALVTASGMYKEIHNRDPIDLAEINKNTTITLVGAFTNYIKTLEGIAKKLYVLEMNENNLKEDQKQHFVPADEFARVIPQSDVIIITGFTLLNNTLEQLLEAIPEGRQVVLVGPSGNIYPELLFQKGITIIGGTRVIDPELVFDLVGQASSGFHLFERGLRKICLTRIRPCIAKKQQEH